MYSKDSAHIAWYMSSASCSCQVYQRIFSIESDHKISSLNISLWSFWWKLTAKVLWHWLFFNLMNGIEIKPLSTARHNKRDFHYNLLCSHISARVLWRLSELRSNRHRSYYWSFLFLFRFNRFWCCLFLYTFFTLFIFFNRNRYC